MIEYILGIVTTICCSLLVPVLRKALIDLALQINQVINKDALNLTDTWEAKFNEPDSEGNNILTNETINLTQRGNAFSGKSNIQKPYPRCFIYQAVIYHNLVWGQYHKSGEQKGAIAGRGVFLLEISQDRKSMEGFCSWMDHDTKKIESSKYVWVRLNVTSQNNLNTFS
jgi:hypothetical protein